MAYDLTLEFILSAKPKRVMQLLTDTGLIRKWSGGEAILGQKEGGAFEMFDGWVSGNVLKVADRELAYTWLSTDWPEGTKPSEVHYILEDDEAGTKLTLHHHGLPDEEEMNSHKTGWAEFFFDPLEDYIMVTEKD
jgi:uncharacterized protein YndB with AHSA1/START domain